MLDAQLVTGAGEAIGFIAGSVVGEHTPDFDAQLVEPLHGRCQEVGRGAVGLIRIHCREGDAQLIIDGDVQELRADAFDPVATVSCDPMRGSLDPHKALDIEMQHVARQRMLEAVGWLLRLDIGGYD